MKFTKIFATLCLAIFLVGTVQAQFTLSGEFRPRTELSHGYKTLAAKNQDVSVFTAQRTRLNAAFKNEFLTTKLVLQDVRQWGSQPQLVQNEDFGVSVHEAWAEVMLAPEFSLKAGRQEVVYDDQRIFGNVGWAHQARSHDMAILKYEEGIKLHFGIAHHENSNPADNFYNGPDAYKDLQFLWFNHNWDKTSLSLLALNNGVPYFDGTEQKNRYSQTLGGRFSINMDAVNLASNLYYQSGKHVSGIDINALNFLLEASVSDFTAGWEYLSGTDWDESGKYRSFTPFYGTNHKFNGFMDYFYVGSHIGSVGLNDFYLKYKYSKNKIGFDAHAHCFAAAAELPADASSYLGTELDLSLSWAMNALAKISLGYSTLFAGESMEILKGGDHSAGQHWAYLMLAVTPDFIK